MLDDLFTYRLDVERYLTVTNAANHERDLAWFATHAQDFPEVRVTDGIEAWAMLAVQGPLAQGDRPGDLGLAAARADERRDPAPGRRRGARVRQPATRARTASSCSALPRMPPRLWDELVRRGAVPAGLGARDTLRLEVCYHLYGNELSVDRGPDRGRARMVLQGEHAASSARTPCARCGRAGPPRSSSRSPIDGPGIARQGNPVLGGGEVTSGTLSPCLQTGIGMAYVPVGRAAGGTRLQIDVRGKMRPAVVKDKPLYRKGS